MTSIQKAIIYCRVSDPAQIARGSGLSSQENICREYANHKKYDVQEVFFDEGITGGTAERPGIQAAIQYLKNHSRENYILIIDDITRLAKDVVSHHQLRAAIDLVGAKLESPVVQFGEDPDSHLIENLLASVAQHQREKNAEQTYNRMRGRMLGGYWVFYAPIGYKHEIVEGCGKMLVKVEPIASIIKEAFKGFASGRFETLGDVRNFLENQAEYPKNSDGYIHPSRVKELFRRLIYSGYMEYSKWDIPLMKAKHEPIIDYDTYNKVQNKLEDSAGTPYRKDIKADFPLRGYVLCDCCKGQLTSCWSKGKYKKYAYYFCFNKNCSEYKVSIKKEVIESDFEKLINSISTPKGVIELAKQKFSDEWDKRIVNSDRVIQSKLLEIENIEKQIEHFLQRIIESTNTTIVSAYEEKIVALEKQKLIIRENIKSTSSEKKNFPNRVRTLLDFFEDPIRLWCSEHFKDKRCLLKLVFEHLPYYSKVQGFRTPQYSLPVRLLKAISADDSGVVRQNGKSSNSFDIETLLELANLLEEK